MQGSAFLQKGVLSSEEFILAGDNLISKFWGWSWQEGDPEGTKPYFPANKQYLVNRNVPCLKRVVSCQGRVLTFLTQDLILMLEHLGVVNAALEDTISCQSPCVHIVPCLKLVVPVKEECAAAQAEADLFDSGPNPDIRTYDISITYDNCYKTPRVWLTGCDVEGNLLKPELVFEDISQDDTNVTVEYHPHEVGPHATVHPCSHAAGMKKFIDVLMSRGIEPQVDMYLHIFLTFMASVMPTMEYDYDLDFDLGSTSS